MNQEKKSEMFSTGALLEELVAVLEHLVNRGDNPEIVIRQASGCIFLEQRLFLYKPRQESENISRMETMFSFT